MAHTAPTTRSSPLGIHREVGMTRFVLPRVGVMLALALLWSGCASMPRDAIQPGAPESFVHSGCLAQGGVFPLDAATAQARIPAGFRYVPLDDATPTIAAELIFVYDCEVSIANASPTHDIGAWIAIPVTPPPSLPVPVGTTDQLAVSIASTDSALATVLRSWHFGTQANVTSKITAGPGGASGEATISSAGHQLQLRTLARGQGSAYAAEQIRLYARGVDGKLAGIADVFVRPATQTDATAMLQGETDAPAKAGIGLHKVWTGQTSEFRHVTLPT